VTSLDDVEPDLTDEVQPDAVHGSRLRVALFAIIAILVLVVAGTAGWVIGNDHPSGKVSDGSVDAGFARDMATHHQQAVVMANYERDYSDNPTLRLLAYNIEETQTFEIGQMTGWLDSWGLVRSTSRPQMQWMAGHDHLSSAGLMPGMATPDQINQFETLRGKALDIRFLQLMIYHHQGGIPMAQYAAAHASKPYVRQLAETMAITQSDEIIQMDQDLTQLGASALAPPSD
jgi:uncharacterized protein (DUF305 family)